MKPSVRRLTEGLRRKYEDAVEEKKETIRTIARAHALTKEFREDKPLMRWWDTHCKGRSTGEVQGILQGGVDRGEISYSQGLLVLDFLTTQGYLSA